jgi:broad specificity phosphatase PhoE
MRKVYVLTTVILVRHGETIWNVEGRVQGHGNSGLSDLGRRQARALAARLMKMDIDAVYCSDLQRARDTIEPYAEQAGMAVIPAPALREKCFGDWEGLTAMDLEKRYADLWHRYHVLRDIQTCVPGGESWDEVRARTVEFTRSVVEKHAGETVMLVGHGGALRPIILHALRAPLTSLTHLSVDNCGISTLNFKTPDDGRVVTLNDCSHLEDIR